MKKVTANWVALAEYDLETAHQMLNSERYLYVVFLCHLALEKMLKAHVSALRDEMPPKTQDLIYLIRLAGLDIPPHSLDFIGKINTASIPTRYPDDLQRALEDYPRPVVQEYLKQTEEIVKWLKQHPNLSK